ncbi:MAG: hypothetical protein ICV77_17145 [Cyanobacteria bacterium Co-bin8]|nr:hypothetical protein [Cyanobacteria bacterium Co-bin8]
MAEADLSQSSLVLLSGLLSVLLALVHLYSGKLLFLQSIPRNIWLSFGSGVSVAYVFVHLIPDLNEAQTTVQKSLGPGLAFLEHHVYIMALVGLAAFYGLERAAIVSRQRNQESGNGDVTEAEVFWLHIVAFALYNALIGYLLLHQEEPGFLEMVSFAVAIALHFAVNDYGLRVHHKKSYDQVGRWILAGSVVVGWVIGSGTEVSGTAIAIPFSFLAGSIVLNVLKEELPEERESRFWAFVLGAGGYTCLVLAL